MTNKDQLIEIATKLDNLKEQFDNHLYHHLAFTIALLTITGGAVTALIIALLS